MDNKGILTKVLAIAGTLLEWLPLLAPLLFGLVSLFADDIFRFDYLMPAEFFPLAIAGGGLLLWAALRARSRSRQIGWGLGVAIVSLFSSQLLAVATGLASGETEVGGWQWALVLALLTIYTLAIAFTGLGGLLLLRDLFKRPQLQT